MEELRSLHKKHAEPRGHSFDETCAAVVTAPGNPQWAGGCQVEGPDRVLATYSAPGVVIRYFFRFTTHLGDTDTFRDRYVSVEGEVVLNEEFA